MSALTFTTLTSGTTTCCRKVPTYSHDVRVCPCGAVVVHDPLPTSWDDEWDTQVACDVQGCGARLPMRMLRVHYSTHPWQDVAAAARTRAEGARHDV